ncbi:30S ribosomal protein S8 [bacterium AB1]|nr:30S ribosomal protein S8 [bacterium AB1]
MSFNSVLASMICNIKVAIKNKQYFASCRYSKFCYNILLKLQEDNVVEKISIEKNKILFKIKIIDYYPLLINIKMVSKPSCRIYVSYNDIKRYMFSFNRAIVSTNKGILSYQECRKQKIGGELLFVYL